MQGLVAESVERVMIPGITQYLLSYPLTEKRVNQDKQHGLIHCKGVGSVRHAQYVNGDCLVLCCLVWPCLGNSASVWQCCRHENHPISPSSSASFRSLLYRPLLSCTHHCTPESPLRLHLLFISPVANCSRVPVAFTFAALEIRMIRPVYICGVWGRMAGFRENWFGRYMRHFP